MLPFKRWLEFYANIRTHQQQQEQRLRAKRLGKHWAFRDEQNTILVMIYFYIFGCVCAQIFKCGWSLAKRIREWTHLNGLRCRTNTYLSISQRVSQSTSQPASQPLLLLVLLVVVLLLSMYTRYFIESQSQHTHTHTYSHRHISFWRLCLHIFFPSHIVSFDVSLCNKRFSARKKELHVQEHGIYEHYINKCMYVNKCDHTSYTQEICIAFWLVYAVGDVGNFFFCCFFFHKISDRYC